jgi:hypothetical protein
MHRYTIPLFCLSQAIALCQRPSQPPLIRVDVMPREQRYCAIDNGIGWLHIHSQIRILNVGSQPALLLKLAGNIRPLTTTVLVANTADDLLRGKSILSMSQTNIDQYFPILASAFKYDAGMFEVLEPQRAYEYASGISVPISRSPQNRAGALAPGQYAVAIFVGVWRDSIARARETEADLGLKEKIWSEVVRSAPIDITILPNPQFENDCQRPFPESASDKGKQ